MVKQSNKSTKVTEFLNEINHPFRNEIEELREYILASNKDLTENIKWNAPNYCYENEDRLTMRIHPITTKVQLIFHRGAKKQEQPKDKLIENKSKMLVWKENDRGIITFKSIQEIKNGKEQLQIIINEWITAAKNQ